MARPGWLKVVNTILPLLILWQVATAFSADLMGKDAFEAVHPAGGILLVVFAVLHVFLNWGWVRSVYLKKG